jgi:phage tail-like protein
MSCVPSDRRFRLLDHLVGWDVDSAEGLEGFDAATGVRLLRLEGGGLPPAVVDARIPPPRLARGCDPCTWYLATPAPPASRLLTLGPCDDCWRPFGRLPLVDAVAVAVDRFRIAVADRGGGRLWIVSTRDGRILGEAAIADPVAVAFSGATVVVAATDPPRLAEYDLGGRPLPARFSPLPPGEIDRLAFGGDCALWLVMRDDDGALALWRLLRDGSAFEPGDLDDFLAAFAPLPILRTGTRGFCLDRGCWNWQGRATTAERIGAVRATALFARHGQLLSLPIDSDIARCRWHRLRIDADVPPGTTLEVALSTSEDPAPQTQGVNAADWAAFAAGVPHPDDWQPAAAPETDVLVRQPAGRYLFLRMRLTGPGDASPVVRRLHLDLPRATSADLLPIVYREEPEAADFTERFMALFDAALGELDEAVERAPALLDVEGVPDALLGWVGGILGTTLDEAWPAERRRALLKEAPGIFRRRGTRGALQDVVRLLADVEPVIDEPGLARAWGAVGGRGTVALKLGRTRLFGHGAARFRLGASALGRSALSSFGNPDLDPHRAGAFHITVALPPVDEPQRRRIARLLEDLVPGHVLIDLRAAREVGFWLIPHAILAVDTHFGAPPPPVLGGSARLDRTSILPARASPRDGLALGQTSACGSC